jgi:hypothetical protein
MFLIDNKLMFPSDTPSLFPKRSNQDYLRFAQHFSFICSGRASVRSMLCIIFSGSQYKTRKRKCLQRIAWCGWNLSARNEYSRNLWPIYLKEKRNPSQETNDANFCLVYVTGTLKVNNSATSIQFSPEFNYLPRSDL